MFFRKEKVVSVLLNLNKIYLFVSNQLNQYMVIFYTFKP